MHETKSPLASAGIWGGLVATGAGIAGIWGYQVTPEMQGEIVMLLNSLAAVIGGVIAIWGRYKATRKIDIKAPV